MAKAAGTEKQRRPVINIQEIYFKFVYSGAHKSHCKTICGLCIEVIVLRFDFFSPPVFNTKH